MDSAGANSSPLSDWVIVKLGVQDVTPIRLCVGANSIGRHSASDFQIESPLVSRHHAEITIPESKLQNIEIKDLNSGNGTYVNDVVYHASTMTLEKNDLIGFGAEYDSDDLFELPIYRFLYEPLNTTKPTPCHIEEIVIIDDDDDNEEDQVDIKPTIPKLPVESRTANQILAIFGKANDVILNSMERLNPIVCEAIKDTDKAEIVTLNSDEEEDAIGRDDPPLSSAIQAEKKKSEEIPVAPSLSVNETSSSLENAGQPKEGFKKTDQDDPKDIEEDEMMFSQVLFDEIKSEMIDPTSDSDHHCSDIDFEMDENGPKTPIISLLDEEDDNSNHSKDEFDEALEQKVSSWSQLLFCSQIIPKQSPPRVFFPGKGKSQNHKTNYQDTCIGSETTLIENLFKSLEDKIGTSELTNSKRKEASRASTTNSDNCSLAMKNKRRRVKQTSISEDTSDEESSHRRKSTKSRSVESTKPKDQNQIKHTKETANPSEKTYHPLHKDKEESEKKDEKEKTHKSEDNKKKHSSKSERVIPSLISAQFLGKKKRNSSIINHEHDSKRLKKVDSKLKEERKERLKRLASTDTKIDDPADTKQTEKDSNKSEITTKTSKVKNTVKNRGAFLCEMQPVKISQLPNKSIDESKREFSTSNQISLQASLANGFSAVDGKEKCLEEVKKVIREKAEQARVRNMPKKLRFSDIDKNSVKNSSEIISNNKASTNNTTEKLTKKGKKAKRVRFNDKPIIHYFESSCENLRKVDRKDLIPRLSYHHRRVMIRRNFPTIDKTDDIISQILRYSNEWLPGTLVTGSEMLTPMPVEFESFEHYKRIVLPLMKLEFISNLEREFYVNAKSSIPVTVILDNVLYNKDRILLVTKCTNGKRQSSLFSRKCDLVLLKIGDLKTRTFAYMLSRRPSELAGEKFSGTSIFLEIMSNSIDEAYLRNSKTITIQPAVDNIQVTIGAYNAIHQLAMTPLYELLLKPYLLLTQSVPTSEVPNEEIVIAASHDKFNDEQKQAIHKIFTKICFNKTETTPNISLVQGPPGTGKSKVVVKLAMHLLYNMKEKFRDKKILICAQSNCAIDSVALKLLNARWSIKDRARRFKLIRFGILDKMEPAVQVLSLKMISDFERIKVVSKNLNMDFQSVEMWKNHLHKLKNELKTLKEHPNPDCETRNKIQVKQNELHTLLTAFNTALNSEQEFIVCKKYIASSNIVCATLSSCVKLYQYTDYFDVCIIDEATQCTEPWTLLPLKFGISSLVLVGDSQQLPATVLSKRATNYGLARSLFTRIESSIHEKTSNNSTSIATENIIFGLRVQYRMHPEICKFPNNFFYKNTLINAENTLQHTTSIAPYSVLNLEYEQNQTTIQGKISNHLEADFVVELLKALNEYIPMAQNTYGVITPYAEHQKFLIDSIKAAKLSHVIVNTIDSYQGQEKDVIIISNARTNGIGFLANSQRLNVAITRPKKCLILCGNFRNLQGVPAWRCLLKDAQQRNLYHEIRPQDINDIRTKVLDRLKLKG